MGAASSIISPKRGWFEFVFAGSNLTTLLALYGFTFSKKLGKNFFWRGAFFICILIEIVDCYITQSQLASLGGIVMIVSNLLIAAIVVPIYVAT
ncbi:MAG: hypothetical protein A2Z83_02315 [Omnitrophica bacterium GWA2_52_8]|nr:MAG: hypothetical protein A2Z83_02315 [Omnitrophica bacterium GWA2_52_8]